MARSNDFALAYLAAHEQAGMRRINITQILQKVAADSSYLFDPEFGRLGGQCPVHPGTRQEDFDKVVVNTALALLYEDLRSDLISGLPLREDGSLILPAPVDSPHGLHPDDPEGLAAATPAALSNFLRDASCNLLDALIRRWAVKVMAEEERSRTSGEITPMAAASFVLGERLDISELYAPSGYNLLSITKTGSHTALHVCWNLLEAAPLLVPGLSDEAYTDLVTRSLKHVVPLSMGSLGMLVHYMELTRTEADDHLAVHILPTDQTGFVYDAELDGGTICLAPEHIHPSSKPGEHYYTGCPAFYTTGLIKLYMEIALTIALQYKVFERMQGRV